MGSDAPYNLEKTPIFDLIVELGRLYGISIGPSDPELITLKGLKLLQASSVVYEQVWQVLQQHDRKARRKPLALDSWISR